MLLDPAGQFLLIGCLVVARVLKISVTWEVMVSILSLSFLFISLLGQFGVEESDFIIIGLEEDGVLKVGPYVHRSFIGNGFVMAGGPRLVWAHVGRAPERHTIMLLFLLSERLLLLLTLLWSFVVEAIFLSEEHLVIVFGVEWRLIVRVIDDIVAVSDVIVNAGLVGIHGVSFLVVVILVVHGCFVMWCVLILA